MLFSINNAVMNAKKLLVLGIFLFSFALYSCGGGGGGGGSNPTPTPYLNLMNVSVLLDGNPSFELKRSSLPDNIKVNFQLNTNLNNFVVELYLSRDTVLSSDDELIYQGVMNREPSGSYRVNLQSQDSSYQTLINAVFSSPYKYYLILNVEGDNLSSYLASNSPFIPVKLWTFAVYMDADNSLGGYDESNLEQMEGIGSTEDVNVVVEDDSDISTTERYYVSQNNLIPLSELGELDMSRVSTLEDFGRWVKSEFPADHYFIVIWDHGLGFESIYAYSPTRDLLQDKTNGDDIMSVPDFALALKNISSELGKKIDIVGIDACLMNMLEVAYEIRNTSNFLVGSEGSEPAEGWPYYNVLEYLVSHPTDSPKTISSKVVELYTDAYRDSYETTQSAIDLSKVENLASSLNNLTLAIINQWNSYAVSYSFKNTIFSAVQRFTVSDGDESYADLGSFLEEIEKNDNMTLDIKDSATLVYTNLKTAVVANGYSGYQNGQINGLTIWYPDINIFNEQIEHYRQLEFARDTNWDEFLEDLTE